MSDAKKPASHVGPPGNDGCEPGNGMAAPGGAHQQPPRGAAREIREKRLAEALKANLKRRKAAKADRKEPH